MKKLGYKPYPNAVYISNHRYFARSHRSGNLLTNLDPLAFLLEGCSYTGNLTKDYGREHGLNNYQLDIFQNFCLGQESHQSVLVEWMKNNPNLIADIRSFGYGIYYLRQSNRNDCRYYFLDLPDLNGKEVWIDKVLKFLLAKPLSPNLFVV